MDVMLIHALTITAAFSQSIVLGVTLFVFFKNLKEMKQHNKMTARQFEIQSKIEKFTLTLKFADWIKSELKDYLPFLNAEQEDAFLSKKEIQEHFESIAKNTVELIKRDIIYRSLLLDEMKKLLVVVKSYSKDKDTLERLEKLFNIDQAWYDRDDENNNQIKESL